MSIENNKYLFKFVCRQCAEESFKGKLIHSKVSFFNVECDACTCKSECAPALAWNFSDAGMERLKNVLSD